MKKIKFSIFLVVCIVLACSEENKNDPQPSSKNNEQNIKFANTVFASDNFKLLGKDVNIFDVNQSVIFPHENVQMILIPEKGKHNAALYGVFNNQNELIGSFHGSYKSESKDFKSDYEKGGLIAELLFTTANATYDFKIKYNRLVNGSVNSRANSNARVEVCRDYNDVMNCTGKSITEQGLFSKILCYADFPMCFLAHVADCINSGCDQLWTLSTDNPNVTQIWIGGSQVTTYKSLLNTPIAQQLVTPSRGPTIDYLRTKAWVTSSWDPSFNGVPMDPNQWLLEHNDGWIFSLTGSKARLTDPNTLEVWNISGNYLAYLWVPAPSEATPSLVSPIVDYLKTKSWVASCSCPGFDGVPMTPDTWTRDEDGVLYNDNGDSKAILSDDAMTLYVYNVEGNYLAYTWVPSDLWVPSN